MNEIEKHLSTPMGIHRLLREPYDDREIFTSMKDLNKYCKSGARYDGQRVGCIIGDSHFFDRYVQNFTISKDFPIIEFDGSELIPDTPNAYDVLVYYNNPKIVTNSMYKSTKSNLNYLENPFQFSILDLLLAFQKNDCSELDDSQIKYNFKLKLTPVNSTETTIVTWTQPFPLYEDTINISTNQPVINELSDYIVYSRDVDSSGLLKGVESSSNTTYYLFPYVDNYNYIVELYISAGDYLKAAGMRGALY